MRHWLVVLMLIISGFNAWTQQPLVIQWLSQGANINGQPADSRFPSVNADGTQVVFQVGNGVAAQLWQAVFDPNTNQWQSTFVPDPDNPNQPLQGLHPVTSADGNHIAFASLQPYGGLNNTGNKQQVYVLDRTQNRIVPISVLWRDNTGNDGIRDTYQPSDGNCIPVYVSSDGRIVVFLAEWMIDDALNAPNHPPGDPLGNDHPPQNAESRLYIVDADGDGRHEPVPIPPTNQPNKWLLLVHDRDADGNGVYDEAGIGATAIRLTSILGFDNDSDSRIDEDPVDGVNNDNDGQTDEDPFDPVAPTPASAVNITANGRFIAFMTTYDNDNDGLVDEDPVDNTDNDGDKRTDEDPPDERGRIIVRDWQSGLAQSIDDAFAPSLSDDGLYLAYLSPTQIDNDGDGQVNEDPVDGNDNDGDKQTDEDPPDFYPQTAMDLVMRRLSDGQELRLRNLQLPPQAGTADGAAGWGYSDWWGAATIAVDPTNPNLVYVAFHSWATDLIDLQNNLVRDNDSDGQVDEDPIGDVNKDGNPDDDGDGRVDEDPPVNFYQGVPNIFLARFDFTPGATDPIRLWRLIEWTDRQQLGKRRGLPVSLEPVSLNPLQYRLPSVSSLMPTVSFVRQVGVQRFLSIVFQSLVPFGDQTVTPPAQDTNGLWDIYLATVPLP